MKLRGQKCASPIVEVEVEVVVEVEVGVEVEVEVEAEAVRRGWEMSYPSKKKIARVLFV